MHSSASNNGNVKHPYFAVSPDGTHLEIPEELFGLLWDFIEGTKQTGSVIVQFRNGGVAGLESLVKKVHK